MSKLYREALSFLLVLDTLRLKSKHSNWRQCIISHYEVTTLQPTYHSDRVGKTDDLQT